MGQPEGSWRLQFPQTFDRRNRETKRMTEGVVPYQETTERTRLVQFILGFC